MSVNITVNGKFSKHSQIVNPEGYKKELENERRKLRLQQVRAQSKELARKIRTDVQEEKQRQLRNLAAVKAQELNLWRKTAVTQKQADFQKAMKDVGGAHVAAQKENELAKEKERLKERQEERAKMRLRMALRQNKKNAPREKKKLPKKHFKEKYCVEEPKEAGSKISKKVSVGFSDECEIISASDTDSDGEYIGTEYLGISDDVETPSLSDISIDSLNIEKNPKESKITQTESAKKNQLTRSPPVSLDVSQQATQSKVGLPPSHIVDKHVESNRQFDAIVSTGSTQATATNEMNETEISVEETPPTEPIEFTERPRYTLISDLLAKQKITKSDAAQTVTHDNASTLRNYASYTIIRHDPALKDNVDALSVQRNDYSAGRIASMHSIDSYPGIREEVESESSALLADVQDRNPECIPEEVVSISSLKSSHVTCASKDKLSQPEQMTKKTVTYGGHVPLKNKISAPNVRDKSPQHMSKQKVTCDGTASPKNKASSSNVRNKNTEHITRQNVSKDRISSTNIRDKSASHTPEKTLSLKTVGSYASVRGVAPSASKISSTNAQNKSSAVDKAVLMSNLEGVEDKNKTASMPPTKKTNRPLPLKRKPLPPYLKKNTQKRTLSAISGQMTTSSKDTDDGGMTGKETVQSYDYNNKYTNEYNKTPKAIALPQNNTSEPNAMKQAEIEKQRLNVQEEELEELRQRSALRGKVALEREQIRRDCVELTHQLDAIMQKKQALLPSDAHIHSKAYLSGLVGLKEAKMNSAIEELLSRPVIITCPDRRSEKQKPVYQIPHTSGNYVHSSDLNLATRLLSGDSDNAACKSVDTDGSGSILLGYIDDQRDQIRSELTQCERSPTENREKQDKLTQLLLRIDSLRESLLKEMDIQYEEESEPIGDNQFSKRKSDFIKGLPKSPKRKSSKLPQQLELQSLEKRERELKQKEILLQKELCEVLKNQQKLKTEQMKSAAVKIITKDKEINERATADKPLEIVIKVKGDNKNQKRKSIQAKKPDNTEKKSSVVPPVISNQFAIGNRNGSYDSNSTAYLPMPAALTDATEQFVDRIQQLESNKRQDSVLTESNISSSNSSVEARKNEIRKKSKNQLNPVISQYVQRLLGMTRESVKALEISSSDVESPRSSIVNVSTNVATSTGMASMIPEDRLGRVEQFVNENRSFINELEESLRTYSNASLETSMRRFEEIWKEKLKGDSTKGNNKQTPKASISKDPKTLPQKNPIIKPTPKTVPQTVSQPTAKKTEKTKVPQNDQGKNASVATKTTEQDANKESNVYATQTQLNHYAELTKNCSNRIAELTALITKVRQEKQRLLEVTLTSNSDNERNSTEYVDLPGAQKSGEKDVGDSKKQRTSELPSSKKGAQQNVENEPAAVPLEKHKPTGRSRDSGISLPSRPVTALEQDTEAEPQSFASSTQTNSNKIPQNSATYRKAHHPPPAIHRYSPQLPQEDAVHELSTIVEVDTPVTSHINTSITKPSQPERYRPNVSNNKHHPVPFPTFSQYIKEFNLDMTTFDPEESFRMEKEYNELVEALKEGQAHKVYSYEEFPTLTTYLKNVTGNEQASDSPETIGDLFSCLRLSTIIAKPFPSHKEYLKRQCNDTNDKYIDSESLENLTTLSGSESPTLNIEEELIRRNLLKKSFRSSTAKGNILSTSVDSKSRPKSKSSIGWTTVETGVEKLTDSTADSASDKFRNELNALGIKWHGSMREREKKAAALCSSTSDSLQLNSPKQSLKPSPKEKKKKSVCEVLSDSESDHPLNLRDFLMRELLKHATTTSTCDSSVSSESLRSQFFMAVLDSMTPSGSPRTNTNNVSQSVGQSNLERKKTSTPVRTPIMQSRTVNDPSNEGDDASEMQLFSVESNLSSVQFLDHKRQPTNKKKNPKGK